MQNLQINLDENEINAILAVLGDMPSKTGTWPLMMKIKVQADAQMVVSAEALEEGEGKAAVEAING